MVKDFCLLALFKKKAINGYKLFEVLYNVAYSFKEMSSLYMS